MPHRPQTAAPAPGAIAPDALVADTSRKFVRVLEERADGLVSFEFSIGWPELAVELLLPRAAFAEFCETNRVIRLEARADPPAPSESD